MVVAADLRRQVHRVNQAATRSTTVTIKTSLIGDIEKNVKAMLEPTAPRSDVPLAFHWHPDGK